MQPIQVTHDGVLDIATGKNRREISWKNRQIKWSALLEKIAKTHRTHETFAEYMSSSKVIQDNIKDVGGFVGGYLTGGKRKPSAVAHRQLITLDIDHATSDTWDNFLLQYECAAAVYSTHKHTLENQRLRLLIPLDREVMADEYVAIGRRIAGDIGIESFDNTGFQPSRLMYWPSTSKDGAFFFDHQDGPWLSADEILRRYHDWRDSSEWPVSEKVNSVLQNNMKKQGDPLEKPGVVGAFCRTYNIHEAIATFLADTYEACEVDDRYTYKEGSTAAGLIVYDDKFAFSHHGTDPTSGKLCNAFDLVRIHLFGLKDEDAKEGTPGNKLPSYTEMISLATKDPAVRIMLGEEKIREAFAGFDDFADEAAYEDQAEEKQAVDSTEDREWLKKMEIDKKGNYLSTINNVVLILENDPRVKGRFAMNEFDLREVAIRHLPWRKVTPQTRYLTDTDDSHLRRYLEQFYGISSAPKIKDALDINVSQNRFHPIRDFIQAQKWDGTQRLDSLFIDYLGAEDTPYVRTVTRKSLVACVARVFEPGTKFDNMPILIGPQGIGKSTILSKLGGEWFSDSFSFTMIGDKKAEEQLQGAWVMEVGELTGLSNADVEAAKSFLSRQEDRYRVAYGKRLSFFPRQCVPFGTSNKMQPLRDSSGNRRFWPIVTGQAPAEKNVFADFTKYEIGQVWAEAYAAYKDGEALFLSGEIKEVAEEVQAGHTETDDRVGMIKRFLETLLPDNWEEMGIYERRSFLQGDELTVVGKVERKQVCAAEIWCEVLGGMVKDMNRSNTKFIHDILQNLDGWKATGTTRKYAIYGYQRTYERSKQTNEQTVFEDLI